MTRPNKAAAVVYAKDLKRVAAFYAEALGFEVAHAESDHMVLESPTFQLIVHAIPGAIAHTIDIADPPLRRTETPIKLVFVAPRIDAVRAASTRLGGELNPPEREWRFQEFTVCDGHDPEGNVFQVRAATV